jgi:DivIVA domain-containing protein
MALSPRDIAIREFAKVKRGYETEEVRAFLERVSDEVFALQKKFEELTKQNAANEAKLIALEKDPRGAAGSSSQSEQEREQIIRQAHVEASQVKQTVEREVQALRDELRGLKLHRDGYVKRFRLLLKSQVELLDLLENDSPETADARTESTAN